MNASIAVIGIGNILFSDDGAGVYAVKMLESNVSFSPSIDIIDGGTLGFKLLDLLGSYEKVIIIDTISIDDDPGSIFVMPSETLCDIGNLRQTAHEVEVVEMLKMAELLDHSAKVSVIGIVPSDTCTVSFNLSAPVRKKMLLLVDQVILQLSQWGIQFHKETVETSIDSIIARYHERDFV